MELTQVWGALLIFTVCPLLGGLPLIAWITYALTGRQLSALGTGNIGVSAAFYHGGRVAGILAVLSEAAKGIAAVLLARQFFPVDREWESISLIALVMGRYWMGKGAGTTNVVWGFTVSDPVAAGFIFLIGGVGFTLLRERKQGRSGVLVLMPLITALLHPRQGERIVAAIALSLLLHWIYQKIPDDLDLPPEATQDSPKVFRFFRGDRAIISLDKPLDPRKIGHKAANLSQLKHWGYPVPEGWVLPPGDDPQPMISYLQPSEQTPLVVRSSAIGEDSSAASAAGQYQSFLNITTREALAQRISDCFASYDLPSAVEYRRSRQLPDESMAVLIQPQIRGVFSGVAFSRDPINCHGEAVVIEALPGDCTRVVSGQVTPEQYRVYVTAAEVDAVSKGGETPSGGYTPDLPDDLELAIAGSGSVPQKLLQKVAFLARHIENRYHGIPQDIEWTYDGQQLWLLQARPITTLLPIWTRKIAAEVIPGVIRPLTWSINRPLTCGVWGELFTLVLGKGARGLDFQETATLHYSRAYFNATLLGEIFQRMGLPPESLEFLTRGAKFTKPPLGSTLRNVLGLVRLLRRELHLVEDFRHAYRHRFKPALANFVKQQSKMNPSLRNFDPSGLLERVDGILELLKEATYYSILAPLSLALRKAFCQVGDEELDYSHSPEVAAVRSLQEVAHTAGQLLSQLRGQTVDCSQLFAILAEHPDGHTVFEQFDRFLERYGYLSDVATDIAIPTWKEDPRPVRELFAQLVFQPSAPVAKPKVEGWKVKMVQRRAKLKGRVTTVYSKLLGELRWSFLALEQFWLKNGILLQEGDVFFLEIDEIRRIIAGDDPGLLNRVGQLVEQRRSSYAQASRSHLEQDREWGSVPQVVYGNAPSIDPISDRRQLLLRGKNPISHFQGIGASAGVVEGRVKIIRNLVGLGSSRPMEIDRQTILVVPYTDSGWTAVLARAGGLISEVGGQLSHGAIVAREYGIPAVMDIHDATHQLRDGQLVRIDGSRGIVEIL